MKPINTHKFLKDFRDLKQKKESMDPEQYLKELVCLKIELLAQFEDPEISQSEEIKLALLLKSITDI